LPVKAESGTKLFVEATDNYPAAFREGLQIFLLFCADVATVQVLDKLSPGELLVLQERYGEVKIALGAEDYRPVGWRRRKRDVRQELGQLHHWLRSVVVPLVDLADDRDIELDSFLRLVSGGRRARWSLHVRRDGTVYIESGSFLDLGSAEATLRHFVMPGAKLPFGRCPQCSRIFPISKRPQTYCSPTCAAQANRENRREQIRENVRRYRQRKKNAALSQSR